MTRWILRLQAPAGTRPISTLDRQLIVSAVQRATGGSVAAYRDLRSLPGAEVTVLHTTDPTSVGSEGILAAVAAVRRLDVVHVGSSQQ